MPGSLSTIALVCPNGHSFTLTPDELPDGTAVSCPRCAAPIGRWGTVKRRAAPRASEMTSAGALSSAC